MTTVRPKTGWTCLSTSGTTSRTPPSAAGGRAPQCEGQGTARNIFLCQNVSVSSDSDTQFTLDCFGKFPYYSLITLRFLKTPACVRTPLFNTRPDSTDSWEHANGCGQLSYTPGVLVHSLTQVYTPCKARREPGKTVGCVCISSSRLVGVFNGTFCLERTGRGGVGGGFLLAGSIGRELFEGFRE